MFEPDYQITADVINDDSEAGTFTVQVFGEYPGGGNQLETTGAATLGPSQQSRITMEVHGADGIQGFRCNLVAPEVTRWQ